MFNKTFLACTIGALLSVPVSAQDDGPLPQGRFVMGGYGDVTYADTEQGNGSFNSRFVPIFLFQLNDKLHVEAELEFSVDEFGAVETELEYADIHYFLGDATTLTAGKFLLPFGQFGPNLHPSWINKLPTMPGIYGGHGGNGIMTPLMPILNDMGVSVQHTIQLKGGSRLFFDFYAVNGPSEELMEEDPNAPEPLFPEVELEAKSVDNNTNKAFGGRIAWAALPSLEIGISYFKGPYDDAGDLDYTAQGFDLSWNGTFSSVKAEWIKTEADFQDMPTDPIETASRDGYYVQYAWSMRQLQKPALNPVELVARYSKINDIEAGERWTLGLNYWMSPSTVTKLAYEDTQLDDGTEDTRVFAQLSYGF
jgi:hypothetical protein